MSEITIRIRDNGPLVVEGAVTVNDAEGNSFSTVTDKKAIALCRCGQSDVKPFCDGAHRQCDFESAPRAPGD